MGLRGGRGRYQLTIFLILLQIRETIFESLPSLDITWVISSLISIFSRLAKYVQIILLSPLMSCLPFYFNRKINIFNYDCLSFCIFSLLFFLITNSIVQFIIKICEKVDHAKFLCLTFPTY